jgi:hypothetical protein
MIRYGRNKEDGRGTDFDFHGGDPGGESEAALPRAADNAFAPRG